MSAPIIQTPDFTLRPFQASDAPAVASGIAHRDVIRMLVSPPYPYALADAVEFIDKVKDDPWHWVIDINGPSGCVAVDEELGYWLAKPYWGRGITTRAVRKLCEIGFAEHQLQRIFARVRDGNQPSIRVLEKCGFQLEARVPKHYFKNGKSFDILFFGKMRNE